MHIKLKGIPPRNTNITIGAGTQYFVVNFRQGLSSETKSYKLINSITHTKFLNVK